MNTNELEAFIFRFMEDKIYIFVGQAACSLSKWTLLNQ